MPPLPALARPRAVAKVPFKLCTLAHPTHPCDASVVACFRSAIMPLSAENQAAKDLLERRGVADPDLRLRSILAAERVTARGCQRASHEADGNSLRDISARLKRYNLADELVERIIGRKRPRDGPPDSAAAPASKAARVDSPEAASTSAARASTWPRRRPPRSW